MQAFKYISCHQRETMDEIFPNVYMIKSNIVTENLVPGKKVYDERLIKEGNKEYRVWDPFRSKLAAAIRKGLKTFPFKSCNILYLGASTGTTISHLSDVLKDKGEIYSVEFSSHAMKKLLVLSEKRENIIPIMGDARKPQEYEDVGEVEIIYQDVAQPDQDDIILMNAEKFLKKGGYAFVAIKSQSIDVTKKPDDVFDMFLNKVKKQFEIVEKMKLEPFDKDHLFVVLKKK